MEGSSLVPTVLAGISAGLMAAHLFVLIILRPRWTATWKFYFIPLYCISCCAVALYWFTRPATFASIWLGGLYSMFAAVAAWQWWNDHEDRRRRLKKKALERVQLSDAGLKVVPED